MIFKLKDYHVSYKVQLAKALVTYPNRDKLDLVSTLSAETGCPVLALLYFLMDIEGETPRVLDKIERVKRFYLIDKVEV